jgi:ATP-dependent helicase/nuclease subunit A
MSQRRGGPPQPEMLPGMELVDTPDASPQPPELAITEEQEQAISRRAEPLALSAAAGSGKTSVLVERFIRAVREDGVAPGRILAITFTERAAGELRARIRSRLLELGDREAARDTEAAFIGTFHGFCARLLRAHPLTVGLDPGFAIIDEGLAGRLRELAFKSSVRQFSADGRTEAVDLLAAYGVDRVHSMIEQVHAELRSRGELTPRLPPPAAPREAGALHGDAAAAWELLGELLERFGLAYGQLKRQRAAVDFDDLELLAAELLSGRESVRAAWSERFELLMVDEFQDTNPRQLEIVSALDRGNLFTVGDEFQSIYGFRHAQVELFRDRQARLAEHDGSLALTWNFRSRKPLLDVINAVFAGRFGGYTPLVAARAAPPAAGPGALAAATEHPDESEPAVELMLTNTRGWEEREGQAAAIAGGLPPAQPWRQAEARMLAQRVAELIDRGQARPGEVVVLLRAAGDLEVFERALQLRGLRTLASVGAFWGHQQIGDLISYLRALANPLDEEALYGALASPLAGCSRDCLALLAEAARARRQGVWETALEAVGGGEQALDARLGEHDRDALASFCGRLSTERREAPLRALSELIERAIHDAGYREHVLSLDWGERRLANMHKLLRLARRFEASEGRDLRAFLDHVEHLREAVGAEPDAPVDGAEPDAVRLMTVHAAKGLEFPVVCVADLGRQPNTQTPDLLVDRHRVGLRLMRLDGASSTPALEYDELCRERRQREAEEEDRILYVAMTRARERLLLSGAADFERWPRSGPPISWLVPVLAPDLPALLHEGEAAPAELAVGPAPGARVGCRTCSPARADTIGELTPPTVTEIGPSAPSRDGAEGAPLPSSHVRAAEAGASAPPGAAPTRDTLATLSYTSLSELERCGYRYYLERVLGVGEERMPREGAGEGGLEARARGTLVHRLMESLEFSHPRPPTQQDVARSAEELGMRIGPQERAEIASLIAAASGAAPALRVAQARSVRREHPFAFSLGANEPLITGVIDLLATEADGCCVVLDYKSDRVGLAEDLAALVSRQYGIQRLLYALAVLREGAREVEIVHWFLERADEPVLARYTASQRAELEERLTATVARALRDPFAVSRSPHRGLCLTCPGRAGLCSWGEADTLRDHPRDADAPAAPDPPRGGF